MQCISLFFNLFFTINCNAALLFLAHRAWSNLCWHFYSSSGNAIFPCYWTFNISYCWTFYAYSQVEKLIKAETAYVKALHDIQKLRLKDDCFTKNQGISNIQITLINFVSSLESQHAEMIHNLKEDILPDFKENRQIQKTYMNHYVSQIVDAWPLAWNSQPANSNGICHEKWVRSRNRWV